MAEITKQSIDDLIGSGKLQEALADLRSYYASAPSLGNAQFVLTRMDKLRHLMPRVAAKVAFLRTFTIEPVVALLRASAALLGVDIEARVGEFGAYAQELLTGCEFLGDFDPDIVVVAIQTRDVLPDVWNRSTSVIGSDLMRLSDRAASDLNGYLQAFRARSKASAIVHSLEQPDWPACGVLDAQRAEGQSSTIRRFNDRLRGIASEVPGIAVLDYDALAARHGRVRWHDEQKWLTARMPIAADCLPLLAQEYLRLILPLVGKVCKALVTDLDNTLWSGVLGEDGIAGIQVDGDYPGAAYQALQRAMLDLYERGVILAIASKNDNVEATLAIEYREGMILGPKNFAAARINWNDKAQSLREIAAELNIGIDSLAFIDDNPVERRRVATQLPEVYVVELPADPMLYGDALRASPVFERIRVTGEDKERSRYYADQRGRAELAQSGGSLEEFYRSLQQVVTVEHVGPETISRVAQLTQKTNQFNLTTKRYTEQEVAAMATDPACDIVCARVCDRFGDNGIVTVAILRTKYAFAEIDTFLMSCRVIGRTVETAVLAELTRIAAQRGARAIKGRFAPTAKNAPAAKFYEQHGFARCICPDSVDVDCAEDAWNYDLAAGPLQVPAWIKLVRKGAQP